MARKSLISYVHTGLHVQFRRHWREAKHVNLVGDRDWNQWNHGISAKPWNHCRKAVEVLNEIRRLPSTIYTHLPPTSSQVILMIHVGYACYMSLALWVWHRSSLHVITKLKIHSMECNLTRHRYLWAVISAINCFSIRILSSYPFDPN
jgi:hypothetical protein